MISFKNVNKFNLAHFFLRVYVEFGFRLFYKKIIIINKNRVPLNEAVILAPNHQNALMDALAAGYPFKGWSVFLARADIFKKTSQAKFLRLLKIVPVFRIRDGIGSLQQNDETFNISANVLKEKGQLVILPEGTHSELKRLRPLKKGIARIAFQVVQDTGFNLPLTIVPIGLDYSNYQNINSTLLINIGEPIRISDYSEQYKVNPPKAFKALMETLKNRMQSLMIHIESEKYYELFDRLRNMFSKLMCKKLNFNGFQHPNKLQAEQQLIKVLNDNAAQQETLYDSINLEVMLYEDGLKKLNFRDWVFEKGKFSFLDLLVESLIMIFLSPVFIYGLVNNFFPYKIPVLRTKKVKDPQFISSFRLVLGILFFLVFYLLQTLAVLLIVDPNYISLIYLFSLPVSGLFALNFFIRFKKLIAKWRFNILLRRKHDLILKLISIRGKIRDEIESLIDDYQKKTKSD